jgi:phosphoglycolate phosphatase
MHAAMDEHVARHQVPVGEGLAELFARLAGRGFSLGLATTDGEAAARAAARALGLAGNLDFVCGYDSGFGSKPEPGMVLGFCEAAGIAPAGVLVVGDTRHDMAMARAAGAGMAVGVLTGVSPREDLAPHADRVIASVLEIESVLA